jgi:hypothetical protein
MVDAARLVGCDKSNISRHQSNHLASKTIKAAEYMEVKDGLNALEALNDQYKIVREWLERAIEGGKPSEVAAMLKEGRKHIELNAKLTGQLNGGETSQYNLMMNPEFISLKDTIINNLGPEERAKLAAALRIRADAQDLGALDL